MAEVNIVRDQRQAETIEQLSKAFEREYDLSQYPEACRFVEGLTEFGKLAAFNSTKSSIKISVGADGITGIVVNATPRS